MTLVYLDSSVLVAIILGDKRGSRTLSLLGSRAACCSEIAAVECQAGLSFQFHLAPEGLPAAERALNDLLSRMQLIQALPSVLLQGRSLVRRYRPGLGLRALD